MRTPLERARRFRSRATECQQLAQSVSSLSLQDSYRRLAQSYITFAEAEEMIGKRIAKLRNRSPHVWMAPNLQELFS